MRDETQTALRELLLALADDEFVMGFANSEWTGIAPVLEEDIAFSSLAQDEIGHARVLYELMAALEIERSNVEAAEAPNLQSPISNLQSRVADKIAYGRAPFEFRHAQIVERPRGDWAYSVTRQFLYDTASYVIFESLRGSNYTPLGRVAASIIREEKYHLMHAHTWLQRLAEGSAEMRQRQREAFDALWPDALGLFEPVAGEAELIADGIQPVSFVQLQQRWLAQLEEPLRRYDLPFPFNEQGEMWATRIAPCYGGRRGAHTQSFLDLYDTMTSVYRLDPEANW
jgi:ring-1,2-phenylacetyl-CoA epoxidase subunit PaaC